MTSITAAGAAAMLMLDSVRSAMRQRLLEGLRADQLDARNAVYTFRRGTLTPSVTLYTRRYCVGDTTGEAIGMTWRIFIKNRLIAVDQQTSPLRSDCTITARLRFPRGGMQAKTTYTATFALNDINGTVLNRRLTIRAK